MLLFVFFCLFSICQCFITNVIIVDLFLDHDLLYLDLRNDDQSTSVRFIPLSICTDPNDDSCSHYPPNFFLDSTIPSKSFLRYHLPVPSSSTWTFFNFLLISDEDSFSGPYRYELSTYPSPHPMSFSSQAECPADFLKVQDLCVPQCPGSLILHPNGHCRSNCSSPSFLSPHSLQCTHEPDCDSDDIFSHLSFTCITLSNSNSSETLPDSDPISPIHHVIDCGIFGYLSDDGVCQCFPGFVSDTSHPDLCIEEELKEEVEEIVEMWYVHLSIVVLILLMVRVALRKYKSYVQDKPKSALVRSSWTSISTVEENFVDLSNYIGDN
ncbi:hypothetical protein GEMRC1_006603 [Eukaryota sp. GEM-RC1]